MRYHHFDKARVAELHSQKLRLEKQDRADDRFVMVLGALMLMMSVIALVISLITKTP
jgi:hypothetical protein